MFGEQPVITSLPPISGAEGEEYTYLVEANDPEGGVLTYALIISPEGMSIDHGSGLVYWIPSYSQAGDREVTLSVSDEHGAVQTQSFVIAVEDRTNNPPLFTSIPDTFAVEDAPYTYQAFAEDPEGDPISYSAGIVPEGMSVSPAGLVTWTPADENVGKTTIAIVASDGNDSTVQSYELTVLNTNDAPVIVSQPPLEATAGADYQYQAIADDPDGDQVAFALLQWPYGMSITTEGLLVWPKEFVTIDQAWVEIEAVDDSGATDTQSWSIDLTEDAEPPTVTLSLSRKSTWPGTDVVVTVDAQDNVGIAAVELTVDGVPVVLNQSGDYVFHAEEEGGVLFVARATDVNGLTSESNATLQIEETTDLTAPVVSLSISPEVAGVGNPVTLTVTATDDFGIDPEMVWLNIDGEYLTLSGGVAEFIPKRRGSFQVLATAYDYAGNYGEDAGVLSVYIEGTDVTAPSAGLSPLLEDTVVTGVLEILGTATDENFAEYTLSYRHETESEWVTFGSGDAPVIDGLLGRFDGTIVENGDYVLRLAVFDTYGNSSVGQTNVRVTGQKKIGPFALAFEDISLNLPGISLSVIRSYDSRVKTEGDFGFGWRMDLKSIRLTENGNQGRGWQIQSGGGWFPSYSLSPTKPHTVTISVPGTRDQVFDVVAEFANSMDPSWGYVRYEPRPGTYSTLEQLTDNQFAAVNGELYELNGTYEEPYNPNRYRLTLIDGTSYVIDQDNDGLVSMTDLNGNTINLSASGISHSAGRSFSFSRDNSGRIASISDATGRVVSYAYDPHGNLQQVTDANGNVTRFKYAPNHYLLEIIDPRGVRATRTEYDDDGRMVRQINPVGDTLYLDHDLDNNTEYTTDFNGNTTAYTYDDRGNILTKSLLGTDGRPSVWEYTYDALDNLLSTRNPDGTVISSTYDSKGNELTSTDERGYTTTRTYNSRGQVLTETDALNRTTTYEYSSTGNLLRTLGPDGVVTGERTYAANGNVLTEKDGEGNLTSYQYDSQGRMIARVDALNRRTGYVLDARGQTVAEVDPDGDSTKYAFDNNGNQVMTVNALGDTTRSTYNVFDKVATQTDALGNVTRFEYDLFGQLKKTVAADSTFTQRTYDGQGNVKTSTDEMGRVTTFEYDHENRLVKTIFPDGSFTEVVYDSRGRRTASIDRNGNRTEYVYDNAGNNTVVRDALGHETVYEYDQSNRRTAMVDALGQRTEYLYDDHDRLVRTTFADGTYKTVTYDDAGRKTAETNQEGNTTAFAYDSVGNLASVTDAMGYVTSYAYDSNNNRISQTDANGNTTAMAYDELNRLVKRTYPNADAEEFGYDANSNMVFKVDGEGDSTIHAFDSRNRETLRRYTNSGPAVRTVYTLDSRRDSVIDYRGATTYQWGDCCGQLFRVDNPDGSFIEYEYDLNKNKTAMITPWARTEYAYDALSRMESVTADDGSVTEYSYNAVGNRDSVYHGANRTSTGYQYDNLNRLTGVTNWGPGGTVISSYGYELNNAGIRMAVTEADGSRVDYGYDQLYRLTSETRTGTHPYSISYVYDNVGNRLSQTRDGVSIDFSYNTRDQLVTETGPEGTITYAYDRDGRMVEKVEPAEGLTYTWEDNDRLASVLGSTTDLAYEYDADGIKVQSNNDGTVTNYLVDHQQPYAQVVAEYDNTLNPSANYTFGLERISQERSGSFRTYLADGQGSIRRLADDAGSVTDEYWYTAFGEELAKTGTSENEFRYVGEQFDPNAGFYYLRARWMNPEQGRFASVDPHGGVQGKPVSLHRYLYANACPGSMTDPSGEFTLLDVSTSLAVQGHLRAATQVFGTLRNYKRAVTIAHSVYFATEVSKLSFMATGLALGWNTDVTANLFRTHGVARITKDRYPDIKLKVSSKNNDLYFSGVEFKWKSKKFSFSSSDLTGTTEQDIVRLNIYGGIVEFKARAYAGIKLNTGYQNDAGLSIPVGIKFMVKAFGKIAGLEVGPGIIHEIGRLNFEIKNM